MVINSLLLFIGGSILIKVYKNILVKSEIPSNVIAEIIERSVAFLTIILVFLILALIIVSYFALKRIVINPLRNLHRGTEIIAERNLDYKVRTKSGEAEDEIDQLAASFDEMALKLKDSYVGLEKKVIQVQERTRQLKEEKSRLLASINSLSLGFIMVDTAGNVIVSNEAVEKFFKPVPEKMVFKNAIEELKPGLDLKTQYETVLKEKKVIDIKSVTFGNKYLRIFMAPILFIEGHSGIIGVVILLEDTTEQELLAESKSNFMAIASHEMRTPLAIIRGDTELLLQSFKPTVKNKKTIGFLSTIRQNSIRLLDILRDFIDVTRLEKNNIEIVKEKFDLEKLTKEIIVDFKNLASQKKLYLKFKKLGGGASSMVMADLNKTRQIITNLLSNALHYTDKGGITTTIESVLKERKKFVKITVADTGIGISPENQFMLFQKFSTIKKTFLHTKEYGSGLGLYISKLLVESMRGTIKLEKSAPGIGSTFSVLLPTGSEQS